MMIIMLANNELSIQPLVGIIILWNIMIRSENCHVTIDQKNHPNIGLIRIIVQVLAIVSCKTRRRSTTTSTPSRSHDSTDRWVSTNERGEAKLSSTNERGEARLANERRRHRTPSTTTTTSTEETKAKLPALEEKVMLMLMLQHFEWLSHDIWSRSYL